MKDGCFGFKTVPAVVQRCLGNETHFVPVAAIAQRGKFGYSALECLTACLW